MASQAQRIAELERQLADLLEATEAGLRLMYEAGRDSRPRPAPARHLRAVPGSEPESELEAGAR